VSQPAIGWRYQVLLAAFDQGSDAMPTGSRILVPEPLASPFAPGFSDSIGGGGGAV